MPRAGEEPHLLILGGTEEAHALADSLAGRNGLRVTSSLAGATRDPRLPAGLHRIGGFGGIEALRDWLLVERVALVIDASHPFALRISAQARQATAGAGCRYIRLERPPWRPGPGDRWHQVADLWTALATLRQLGARRVFAALGVRAIPALQDPALHFVLRGIEPPSVVPRNVHWIGGRGPFTIATERRLLERHGIDAVLCRNSGGGGAAAKLAAARELRLPVTLIERPAGEVGEAVPDVDQALALIEHQLGDI
jgi:precorrin-6A/cobalt-precorrin-6A reductase